MALGLLRIEWACVAGELVNKTALVWFSKIVTLSFRFSHKGINDCTKTICIERNFKKNDRYY